MYDYYATLVRVIDGDTIVADVDVGFYCSRRVTLRLKSLDAPEPRGTTRAAGVAASEHLEHLIRRHAIAEWSGRPVVRLRTEKNARDGWRRRHRPEPPDDPRRPRHGVLIDE